MAVAFHTAGFETWDINMEDLCSKQVTLEQFRGVAFVGGFSYADVCGSAKGRPQLSRPVQINFQYRCSKFMIRLFSQKLLNTHSF